MSSPLIVLEALKHLHNGWRHPDGFKFCANDLWAPVHMQELPSVLAAAPLVFVLHPDVGFQLAALQGLREGENLFVDTQGRWQSGYIPRCYMHYPFLLREAVAGDDRKFVVCFDANSGLYRETPDPDQREERFFTDEGKPGTVMQRLVAQMRADVQYRLQTIQAVNVLAELKLFAPWQLAPEKPHQDKPFLKGIFRINAAAFNALPGASLEKMRDTGTMTIVYAHAFSIQRLDLLLKLHNQKYNVPSALDLEQLFDKKDDIFKFS